MPQPWQLAHPTRSRRAMTDSPSPRKKRRASPTPEPPARAEPIDRLRDDVRLLGDLVGEVLREQGGAALFEAVEHLRTATIALRSTPAPDPLAERELLR